MVRGYISKIVARQFDKEAPTGEGEQIITADGKIWKRINSYDTDATGVVFGRLECGFVKEAPTKKTFEDRKKPTVSKPKHRYTPPKLHGKKKHARY
jgi:hypothetical protein